MKVIIIGAGAAGLTSAIFAAESGAEVILLERTRMPGKKILISGGTRCNVLPVTMSYDDYFTNSSKNLMKNIFKSWSLEDCYQWFIKDIGLNMVTEEKSNKWFPASNSAKEVRDLLVKKAEAVGVSIIYHTPVDFIKKENDYWICRSTDGETYKADRIVVATGGFSLPEIGTDGMGHGFIKRAGHSINKTYPALTPLKGPHPDNVPIPGISLDVELSVKLDTKKKKKAERSGFLFTHRGYSGPAILDLSHYAILAMEANTEKPELFINWNGFTEDEWKEIFQSGKGLLVNKLKEYLPNRLAEGIAAQVNLTERNLSELKKEERNKLIELLTRYQLPYNGHEGYRKAEVTGGGVPLEEIDTATLESKLLPGLYLCGEILDVFGRIGGFNFYWAWVTGRLSGLSAAKQD
jgi:predicted Rossmann fold flavoprotein